MRNRFSLPFLVGCILLIGSSVLTSCNLFKPKVDERDFAVSDTAAIQKIFIADKGTRTIELVRKNASVWTVNGKYPARPDAIRILLETIKEIRVNRPVPMNGHNAVIKDMAANAIKVAIFTGDKDPIRTYYIGGVAKDYNGNYFLMEGAEHPFVVEIPGFDGFVSVRYILDELDWRNRTIMAYEPSDLHSVKVQYFDERANESFELLAPDLNHYQLVPEAPVNEKKCAALFESFRNLNAINYARHRPQDEEARKKPPFAELTVTANNGQVRKIALIHADATDRTKQQFDPNGKPMSFDSEIYYAWVDNNADFLLIQDFMLRNILLNHKDFVK